MHRALLVEKGDHAVAADHRTGGFVRMDDAEHGVAVAGEIFKQRGVRTREPGVAVREHDHRKARGPCRRRRVEDRVRDHVGQAVEHTWLAHQLREALDLGQCLAQVRRRRATRRRGQRDTMPPLRPGASAPARTIPAATHLRPPSAWCQSATDRWARAPRAPGPSSRRRPRSRPGPSTARAHPWRDSSCLAGQCSAGIARLHRRGAT